MTVRIIHGDCRDVLRELPVASVHCCVTSPPYWGLRSYLPADHPQKHREIGSEPTVDAWVQTIVEVMREVRRVLRDDGTLFLNLGDSYNAATDAGRKPTTASKHGYWENPAIGIRTKCAGLKPKDLIGQPWLVAFALRADGWYLRQEIIWAKDNPMPESVRDRFTKAHEHIFLLSKSERYVWNFEALQEPVKGGAHARRPREYSGAKRPGFGHGYDAVPKGRYRTPTGWDAGPGDHRQRVGRYDDGVGRREGPPGNPAERKLAQAGSGTKNNASMDEALAEVRSMRNPRSVWSFPTHPFRGAHFATFPPELARGSGTVGLVADQMHLDAILIDLDERNVPMARDRVTGDAPLFAEVSHA